MAPLAALLVAFLLWMTVRAHIRRRRRGAPVRPTPSADRATVLHGRAVEPSELDDDHHLTTRLLDFGPAPLRHDPGADAPETATRPPWLDEDDEDEVSGVVSVTSVASRPVSAAEPAAGPLPKRTRTGANPIKRANTDVPVVPGAAAPVDPPAEGTDRDDRASGFDDGFDDEPPPGDPATDEADAPTAPVAEEPRGPAPGPGPVETEPLEPDPRSFDASEPEDAAIPDTALWEPPADAIAGGTVADYVPPEWTPPEDDEPPHPALEDAPEDEEPTPVLDHDAGPEVRAAFGIGSVPPRAATPEPVQRIQDAEPRDRYREPEPVTWFEDGFLDDAEGAFAPETDPPPVQAAEHLAEAAPPPESAEPASRPVTERRTPLEKRPVVLRPRRPPMTDLTPGPPSGRVRSEPLPPGD
ncbi:hypothetical protein BJF83_16325 [Nocardiopsis sp. CNR-923]|nr:hypothetical protein BJF83_16325 [Nocardiopsis sp. CNR-923]